MAAGWMVGWQYTGWVATGSAKAKDLNCRGLRNGLIGCFGATFLPGSAMTLGNVILIKDKRTISDDLLDHEEYHANQWAWFGLATPGNPLIGQSVMASFLLGVRWHGWTLQESLRMASRLREGELRPMPRIAISLAVMFVASALAACDDPPSAIGVTLSESGQTIVLYDPCKEARRVSSVEVEAESGRALWRIESEAGSLERQFEAGSEPEGFTTSVPLVSALEGQRLRVVVSGVGPEYFGFDELRHGSVLVVGEGSMTESEFWARDTCD